MDKWLKWIVAAACVVVIVAGGIFGGRAAWSSYQAHMHLTQEAQTTSDCELTVLKLARFVKTNSAYEDEAKAMTAQARHCLTILANTTFPQFAENAMREAGYNLDDSAALPSAD